MAASLLAVGPVNVPGGAILTFLFPMLLFAVIGTILWGLFAGWDWPVSRRLRPPSIHRFQTVIASGPEVAAHEVPATGRERPAAAVAETPAAAVMEAPAAAVTEATAESGGPPAVEPPGGAADDGGSDEAQASAADAGTPDGPR